MVSDSLKWVDHIDVVMSKPAKRLLFLKKLRRAGVAVDDLVHYYQYQTVERPVLEYIIIIIMSYGGRCRSYELAPCLPILSSVIGSCQTNVQGRQVRFNGP